MKLLDCTCSHEESDHLCWSPESQGFSCDNCSCKKYDPNGHNPEVLNFICPQCRLTWLVPLNEKTYYCCACNYVAFEKQIKEWINERLV